MTYNENLAVSKQVIVPVNGIKGIHEFDYFLEDEVSDIEYKYVTLKGAVDAQTGEPVQELLLALSSESLSDKATLDWLLSSKPATESKAD